MSSSLRRDPVRLVFSAAPWASAWYLLSYLITGTVLFAIALTAVLTAGVLSFTLAGLPLLIAAAVLVRWCANVERARLRTMDPVPVSGGYREVTGPGLVARLRTRWHDPATWRDIAYLLGLFGPLLALDCGVLLIWLTLLAGLTVPAWYRAPARVCIGYCPNAVAHGIQLGDFPHGPHGPGGTGLYVDTLPSALLVAAVCLILFLLFNYVLVATARLHATVARGLLRPPEDPLREAKEVLRRPGPLRPFMPNGQW